MKLAAAAITLLALAAAQPPPATTRPQLSMRVPVAPAAVMTDGVHRLLYELHIENRGDAAITLTSLAVHTNTTTNATASADLEKPAVTVDGDRLIRALDVPADRNAPLAIAAGARRVLYVDLGEKIPPRALRHVLRAAVSPAAMPAASPAASVEETLNVTVDPTPPVVLGPPLSGGPWAAVYHSDWERGHRRVFYTVEGVTRLPGRHTIDFVKLDDGGRTARADGNGDLVADSLGYGVDVLAVNDAMVAAVRDDMPEVTRVSARVKHQQHEAAGNYVSLDLGKGRFAVYEHLKPRSIKVRPGQRVRRGDVIAQLGFTGDSTGPHLHLHVGDAASPLAAEGQPFVFDRFEALGRYADIGTMGKARWQSDSDGAGDGAGSRPGPRQNERPGPNAVITFTVVPSR
jgi:murein DD-endopeptidase